ncbi:MAG TPA: molybdenum ABC transporter ATP-binding protein [Terriglobales bacterium]|nr:molybdenum ABC transporter ATP-binding protein [Terriglobales bacterium]
MKFDVPSKLEANTLDSALHVQIRREYCGGDRDATFSLDVNFRVPSGITMLFGPSGAGKTTVLDCIAGVRSPDSGRIELAEQTLFESAVQINIRAEIRRIGYVFQSLALFPHLTAEQNIHYGLFKLPVAERRRRAAAILDSLHIAHLRNRRPRGISGGERQRVALARALVTQPKALLLDEPLSALDAATKAGIMDDLRAWNEQHRIPVLYVTHSREEVFALGERVIALEQGRVVAEGTPLQVLSAPRTEAIAGWMGLENIFDAEVLALHEKQGTMLCRLASAAGAGPELEIPLGRSTAGDRVRVGIGAGEILIATRVPEGISARNVLQGELKTIERRDAMLIAKVDSGILFEVHLTPGAQESLQLVAGKRVWLVIKTYSCHLLQRTSRELL